MEQRNHYNTEFQQKKFPITVICNEVYLQQNIGSIFRICEAFGIQKIIFTGKNFVFSERKIKKTSRSTHKIVPYEIFEDKEQVIDFLKQTDSEIIALEITSKSQPISHFNFSHISKPLIILLGSESYGISKEFLQFSNYSLHIEMFGKNSSMNVTQALSIMLYEVTKTKE